MTKLESLRIRDTLQAVGIRVMRSKQISAGLSRYLCRCLDPPFLHFVQPF
jgi:hypothetical protein